MNDDGTSVTVGSVSAGSADGRHARKERNRSAVIDAYIELVSAGNMSPTIDDLAQYTGISLRSIYRYFDDSSEMMSAVTERTFELARPFLEITDQGEGDLDHRIAMFVQCRVLLHRKVAPITRAARARHSTEAPVVEKFARVRSYLGRQVTEHFRPEIGHLDHDARKAKVAGIYFAFVHDSLELLWGMYPDDPDAITEILTDHLRRHLRD
jgi:AcrR family transcriptional regulator